MYEYLLENGVQTLYYAENKQIRPYPIADALRLLKKPDQQLRQKLRDALRIDIASE